MDPLTALSIASNVVQFIDFGTRLLKHSGEIYTSAIGAHKPLDELAWAVRDLQSLTKALKTSTAIVAESSPQTRNDVELLALAREAESSADELLTLLAKFQPKGRGRLSSVGLALKYTLQRRELEAGARRLDTLRAKLELIL